MKSKMVLDERGDEEIAVIVAVLKSQLEWNAEIPTRGTQQFRLELAFEERIVGPLIDQYWRTCPAPVFNQRGRIVFPPTRAVPHEIARQHFLAPWTSDRRCDRREGGHPLFVVRVLEPYREGPVPAHRMTGHLCSRRLHRQ